MISTNSPNERSKQGFRRLWTADIEYIPTREDPSTGNNIVLLSDIRCMFGNVNFIKKEASLVPFITNENLEPIVPLRIAYHPDDVLDLIVGGNDQADSIPQAVCHIDVAPTDNDFYSGTSTAGIAYVDSPTDNTASHDIPDINTSNRSLTLDANKRQIYNSYIHQIRQGQEMQAANIAQIMDERFEKLFDGMNKKTTLQEQSLLLQKRSDSTQQEAFQLLQQTRDELLMKASEVEELHKKMGDQMKWHYMELARAQQEMREEVAKKQEELLRMQKQTNEWLATIQKGLQVLLTQNYELHEYPIPRLFIVLPKTVGERDMLPNPFVVQYRLYFLCECGTHTMSKDSKTQHHIHLAKHEGYDLDKPTEFFQMYGTYLLAMMSMIKIGITLAGVAVPSLASLKILDGLDVSEGHFADIKKNISVLVDDTIKMLENYNNIDDVDTPRSSFEQPEALEGAELRQLESFLRNSDRGRVFGNLYRIVTEEGHVKWVCRDHYRDNYREAAVQHLRNVVETNHGTFTEETGKIEIKIESSTLAKQFYEAMVKARGIHELEITLGWRVDMDDLRSLTEAVSLANVLRLAVDGCQLKRPMSDMFYRGRRFDPFARLVSNGRLQSLHLNGKDDFFSRISTSLLAPAPKLRHIAIDLDVPVKEKAVKAFHSFTSLCEAYTTIELKLRHTSSIETAMQDIFHESWDYEPSSVGCDKQSIIVIVSGGVIREVAVEGNSGGRRQVLKRTLSAIRSSKSNPNLRNPIIDTIASQGSDVQDKNGDCGDQSFLRSAFKIQRNGRPR